MPPSDPIGSLAERFLAGFRRSLGPVRRVGVEAEFPLVFADGKAAPADAVWAELRQQANLSPRFDDPQRPGLMIGLESEDLIYSLEVGRATVELSLGPYDDLWQLDAALRRGLGHLCRAAAAHGARVLGFGIQPRSRPTAELMTPRRHYLALFAAVGKPWLRMTTTASTQLHVDIQRREVVSAVNGMNLLSGPIIALCANSSVYGGRPGAHVCGREALLRDLGEDRYGMPPGSLPTAEALIRHLSRYHCFLLPRGPSFLRVDRPFAEHLARSADFTDQDQLYQDFLWHEHYVWNSARARVAHSTIEVRPACQQPPGEAIAAHALILGLVESLAEVHAYLQEALGPEPWGPLAQFRRAAIRDGLAAHEPVPGFLQKLLELAAAGLARRGRGEEACLPALETRLARRESPGHAARRWMIEGGVAALIEHVRIDA